MQMNKSLGVADAHVCRPTKTHLEAIVRVAQIVPNMEENIMLSLIILDGDRFIVSGWQAPDSWLVHGVRRKFGGSSGLTGQFKMFRAPVPLRACRQDITILRSLNFEIRAYCHGFSFLIP
jgi:hypothetical protein